MFGFREILTWNTMKYALISGLLVMAIWTGIGLMVWSSLVHLSEWLIGLLPLNMLIADGASMMSTFIWVLIVFLSFALIYIFFGNFILSKVSREKYASFSLMLMLGLALFWLVMWFVNGEMIHDKLEGFLKTLPYSTVEHGLAYLFAGYLLYNGVVISMLFMVNIFNRPLIKHLSTKHYDGELSTNHGFNAFGYTFKDTVIFVVVSLMVFPLFFIPFVNLLSQIALWMWLTKDTLQYNTASLVFDEVNEAQFKSHRSSIWFISFVTVLFNFIPIFNIFAPFFGEISMFHYWKQIQQKG